MSGTATSARIVSLDQFRGYTVAGMILVNYLGDFNVTHPVFRHTIPISAMPIRSCRHFILPSALPCGWCS